MAYWQMFAPRATVAERRAKAKAEAAAHQKRGVRLEPVRIEGRTIARSFWGKSWCDNIERYRDFAYRLERGRSYVRSGSVIDLRLSRGRIDALVSGTDVYRVRVEVTPVVDAHWQRLVAAASGAVGSLLELLQGKLDAAVMAHVVAPETGLFPTPDEIEVECSCPDIAGVCKHVAAVLYGVGARLDARPELLFTLRGKDPEELVAGVVKPAKSGAGKSQRVLADDDLASLFGVELVDAPEAENAAQETRARPAIKVTVIQKPKAPAKKKKKKGAAKKKASVPLALKKAPAEKPAEKKVTAKKKAAATTKASGAKPKR